ncbi:MAG: hypothetical protein MK135_10190 [Polyangiaceae bacterium]|nr:hypothetical protein [Polyangiaceae bacterium]
MKRIGVFEGFCGQMLGIIACLALSLFFSGCRCESETPQSRLVLEEAAEPADPPPLRWPDSRRCRRLGEGASQRLPLPPELSGSPTELGSAVPWGQGWALPLLVPGEESRVYVAGLVKTDWTLFELGLVYGQTEAPQLLGLSDGWVAMKLSSDAGNLEMQFARLDGQGADAQLVWGASLLQGRDVSLATSLALGPKKDEFLVVWDEPRLGSARSRVAGRRVSLDGLVALGNTLDLGAVSQDSDQPRIFQRKGGYWLTYLVYEKLPDRRSAHDQGLVSEAPASIWGVKLDKNGQALTEPLSLSGMPESILTYDAEVDTQGRLVVAWRQPQLGLDGQEMHLRLASLDEGGAQQSFHFFEVDFDAGAPEVLSRGEELEVYLGSKQAGLYRLRWHQGPGELIWEPEFHRGQPLWSTEVPATGAVRGNGAARVIVARPEGLSSRLEELVCQDSAAEGPG